MLIGRVAFKVLAAVVGGVAKQKGGVIDIAVVVGKYYHFHTLVVIVRHWLHASIGHLVEIGFFGGQHITRFGGLFWSEIL